MKKLSKATYDDVKETIDLISNEEWLDLDDEFEDMKVYIESNEFIFISDEGVNDLMKYLEDAREENRRKEEMRHERML